MTVDDLRTRLAQLGSERIGARARALELSEEIAQLARLAHSRRRAPRRAPVACRASQSERRSGSMPSSSPQAGTWIAPLGRPSRRRGRAPAQLSRDPSVTAPPACVAWRPATRDDRRGSRGRPGSRRRQRGSIRRSWDRTIPACRLMSRAALARLPNASRCARRQGFATVHRSPEEDPDRRSCRR
jgi:hypothetical protein